MRRVARRSRLSLRTTSPFDGSYPITSLDRAAFGLIRGNLQADSTARQLRRERCWVASQIASGIVSGLCQVTVWNLWKCNPFLPQIPVNCERCGIHKTEKQPVLTLRAVLTSYLGCKRSWVQIPPARLAPGDAGVVTGAFSLTFPGVSAALAF